jgi:hypothetical protein
MQRLTSQLAEAQQRMAALEEARARAEAAALLAKESAQAAEVLRLASCMGVAPPPGGGYLFQP